MNRFAYATFSRPAMDWLTPTIGSRWILNSDGWEANDNIRRNNLKNGSFIAEYPTTITILSAAQEMYAGSRMRFAYDTMGANHVTILYKECLLRYYDHE